MKRSARTILIVLLSSTALLFFQNCSQQNFSSSSKAANSGTGGAGGGGGPIDDAGDITNVNNDNDATGVITQTGGPNCRDELQAITTPVRVLFVVDVSGSNKENIASDPQRVVRGRSIERFFNTYSMRANFSWGFVTFADMSANALIGSGANPLFGTASAMANALDLFTRVPDAGATPYEAALNASQNAVSLDTSRPANVKYVIVFLSDGRPNPDVSQSILNSRVSDIVNTVPGKVSFNTVYYGPYDSAAVSRLRGMASTGGGNFLDTNANPTGTAFLITDLVTLPGVVCN